MHYRVHSVPSPVPTSSQINTIHTVSLRAILTLSSHLHKDLINGLFPLRLSNKDLVGRTYAFLVSRMRATWPGRVIFLIVSVAAYLQIMELMIGQVYPRYLKIKETR
jgi:hypothetical protein